MDIFTIQEEAYKRGYEAGVKSVTDNNVGGKVSPTDREKLIELLNKANADCVGTDCFEGCKFYEKRDCLYNLMAEVLIANGVRLMPEPPKGE